MKNAIEWFARNSVAANLLMVLIIGRRHFSRIQHPHGNLPRDFE